MKHVTHFFNVVAEIAQCLDLQAIENLALSLSKLRGTGRLFILGVGGSAANAAHAVNDFRKLCHIETYAPTDNVSELTARTNDEGWDTVFSGWLQVSNVNANDAVLVLSVGGGNLEKNVSVNLINAIQTAKRRAAKIFGIVGRDGGYTATVADVVVKVPVIDETLITPQTEAYQAVIWHCLVSHPALQQQKTKW